MTRQGRKVLFLWAVALFILLSTLVLTFAFGFRYDFKNNRLAKTGSLVIKPNTEAQIFINNKLEGRTSFLNGTFSKKQLLPGSYLVKVQKDNYVSWQKEIEIKEGLVSDFSRIILFGQEQVENAAAEMGRFLSVNREGQKIVYAEKGSFIFYNLGGSQPIYKSEALSLDPATLKFIWGTEGQEVLAYDQSKIIYFDLIQKTFRHLGSSKSYFLDGAVLSHGRLYFLKPALRPGAGRDLAALSAALSIEDLKSRVISKNLFSFLAVKNELYAVSSSSALTGNKLIKMNLDGGDQQILGEARGKILKKIENREGIYYVLVDSNLFALKNNEIVPISIEANGFAVSPDNTAIGWYNDREFWIEWIKDTVYQPLKKSGEKELVFKGDIRGFNWYRNNSYVFLELDSSLVAIETDLRGGLNSYPILSLTGQERAWYDLEQNKIFKLNGTAGVASIDVP